METIRYVFAIMTSEDGCVFSGEIIIKFLPYNPTRIPDGSLRLKAVSSQTPVDYVISRNNKFNRNV